jgi:uncharacterized oligopeptide transporter (OPT) family protein
VTEPKDEQRPEPMDPPATGEDGSPPLLRSALTGMVVGSILSSCNIYSGLKIGWSSNMSVTGALLSYAGWRLRSKRALERSPYTIHEANLAQTAASSAAAVSSAGLVAGIPALTVMTGQALAYPQLVLWVFSVCLVGIMIAVPLRRQLLIDDPLPFPMGVACGETLKQMYAKGDEALARVSALGVAAAASAALKLLEHLKIAKPLAFPGALGGFTLKNLTFALDPSLLLVGVGGIMGARAAVSLLLGAVISYGVLAPWLLEQGLIAGGKPDKGWFKEIVSWTLWPGVTLMVTSSLASLALSWRTLVRGVRSIRLRGAAGAPDVPAGGARGLDDVVPPDQLFKGVLAALALSLLLQIWFFGIPWWAAVIGVGFSALLALVAARVVGETGVTPVGAMGKVTQLTVGAALPGDVTANLMTANVTGGAASQCGDLRTGQMLGSSPRAQWLAQLCGAVAGAVVGSAIYMTLIPDPKTQLMTAEWAAPAVITWRAVAEVFQVGLAALPRGTPVAVAIAAVVGIGLAVLEGKAPPRAKPWIPSPSAMGLAMVVAANQSISMFLGGMAGLVAARFGVGWHGRFWIVVCSGAIAGEGVAGAALSVWQMLVG